MSARPAPPVSPAVRVTTVAAVVVVALVAALVSYSHMQEVAQEAGESWRSWLVPLSVDGLVVAGSMVLLTRRRAGLPGGWLAWSALLGGVGASLAANMAAAEPTITARLVAAWPAVAFAVAFELLLQQRRGLATGPAEQPDPARDTQVNGSAVRHGPAQPVPTGPPPQAVAPAGDTRTATTVPGTAPARPLVPLVPAATQSIGPDRSGFAPAVSPPDLSDPPRRTGQPDKSADRSVPVRSAPGRTGPADRSGQTRHGKPRTDAELSRAVRQLAEQAGGAPSTYQVRQLGVGAERARRLLAELATTTNGTAPKGGH